MASSIYGYAFLKAAYGTGLSNPLDCIVPLVKRCLETDKKNFVDQALVQERILGLFGIRIPLTVIRYSFPKLASENILSLDKDTFRYYSTYNKAADAEIAALEETARARYSRVLSHIDVHLDSLRHRNYRPEQIIEDWLDKSSLGFLGGANPAFKPDNIDYELNRIIQLSIIDPSKGHEFLTDLTEIALGDSLYRAIRAVTEFESDASDDDLKGAESAFRSRMDDVKVYFDTPFVFRALGYSHEELVRGAQEVLNLSRKTGCKICVFEHSVNEIKRSFRGEIIKLSTGELTSSDITHYAASTLKTAGDLAETSAELEKQIVDNGFQIIPAPLYEETDWALDTTALDLRLSIDLSTQVKETREADVDSLAAIFNLRKGEPKKYLEKCDAIFVTTTKGVADSSVRHFRELFRERKQNNQVQICMTDVVFATRLWTKLPTSLAELPREQIVSHILASLKPSEELKQDFLRHLKSLVSEGRAPEETIGRMKLTQFVDEILATDYDRTQKSLTKEEAVSSANRIIQRMKLKTTEIIESKMSAKQQKLNLQIQELRKEFDEEVLRHTSEIDGKDQEIAKLKESFERTAGNIIGKQEARKNLDLKFGKYIRVLTIFTFSVIVFLSIQYALFNFLAPSELAADTEWPWLISAAKEWGSIINLIGNVILTGLTIFGLSFSGALRPIQNRIVTIILEAMFDESSEEN